MAIINKRRLEEAAVDALRSAFRRSPYLEPYISENDRTPSWDGTVLVYNNVDNRKDHLLGRVAIQVKGTQERIVSSTASFSCAVSDLRNYFNDGGCAFFLVSVNPDAGWHKIFYSSLLPFDLGKVLESAGKQSTYTIHLKEFPEDDVNEVASLFMLFLQNRPKQMSIIGNKILSLEELEKSGADIECLRFGTAGVGIDPVRPECFLTTHDTYLYAKPRGFDVDIPVEKLSNVVVSKKICGAVSVKGTVYFPFYQVQYDKGQESIKVGNNISLKFDFTDNHISVNFQPKGDLSETIHDLEFLLDMLRTESVTLNSIEIPLHGDTTEFYKKCEDAFSYYKDVKAMLELLGVKEDLQRSKVTERDERNIRNLVNGVLYGRGVALPDVAHTTSYGFFEIANLKILIWITKRDDGTYTVENFFDNHPVAAFDASDVRQEHPINASQYFLLTKDVFIRSSNLDCNAIRRSVEAADCSPHTATAAVYLVLEILKGYDAQQEKNSELLDLASSVCDWIEKADAASNNENLLLNRLQIAKRIRPFKADEIALLVGLKGKENPPYIRCGAFLLLDELEEAQSCFNELTPEEQKEFLEYPICVFGQLHPAREIAGKS